MTKWFCDIYGYVIYDFFDPLPPYANFSEGFITHANVLCKNLMGLGDYMTMQLNEGMTFFESNLVSFGDSNVRMDVHILFNWFTTK